MHIIRNEIQKPTSIFFFFSLRRLRTKRPDGHTHPFLAAIFKLVEVGPDIRGMMSKSVDLIISEPILVGTHTGGPTFMMQSTGAFATTISVALSHKFATKTLRSERGLELYMRFVLASAVSYDEYREGLIISVLKTVSNKPLYVAQYENNPNHLISIDDVVGDYLDTFAIINTNPTGVFERIHYLCSKRLNDLGIRKPDLYVATKEHFAGQRLFGVAGNLQQSGEQGQRNLRDQLVQPTLTADGGSVKCYTLEYYTAPLSRQHILLQNATIGSFCAQKFAIGTTGLSRYFHGHDTSREVTLRRALENIRKNFMIHNGKKDDDADWVFKDIPESYFTEDVGDDDKNRDLLTMAVGKDTLKEKLETIVGFMVDGKGKRLEKIGDIDEKFLPTSYVTRWFLEFGKNNAAGMAAMSKGGSGTRSSSSASPPEGDADDSSTGKKYTEIIREYINDPDNNEAGPVVVTDDDGNSLRLGPLYKFVIDSLKGNKNPVVADSPKEAAEDLWSKEDTMTGVVALALGNQSGKDYDVNAVGDLQEKAEKFQEDNALPTFEEAFSGHDLPNIGNSATAKELKKLHGKGGSGSGSKFGSGSTGKGKEREYEALALKNVRKKSDIQLVNDYFNEPLTYNTLVGILDLGLPMPYKTVIWAPNIIYSGFPIVGVASGEPGYMGMGSINLEEREVDNKQTTVELDATVLMFVEQPNAIARRDMAVVTDVKNKDYHDQWLVINKKHEERQKGDHYWSSEPHENRGSVFATFDAWTNDIHPIASFFGYHFTPKSFLDPTRIFQNQNYHHMMAPQVLIELERTFGKQIKNDKNSNMFRKDHYFGITGLTCRESFYSVMNDNTSKFHAESKLWPADESFMHNSLRRRIASARIPNSITEKDY